MFACVAVVRSLLVPGTTLLLVRGLAALRLLPDDPVCTLSVLIQVGAPNYICWLCIVDGNLELGGQCFPCT